MQNSKVFQNKLIVILIFIIVGFGVYWNSFNNPFEGDDFSVITENENIRDIKNVPLFFMNPRMLMADPTLSAGHYRPLVVMSNAVNYAIGGLSPVSYHVTNLIFHIGTAFLVFLIVNALFTAGFWAALAAGIIFLVHPFNSEAVNYITARSSVMSGFFYLLGFWCWIKFRQGASYFYMVSFLAFIAGMLSKEVVITLPVIFWFYDRYGFAGDRSQKPEVRSQKTAVQSAIRSLFTADYLSYLPFILVVVAPYIFVRLFSFGYVLPPLKWGILTQIFTEAPALLKHWTMFLLPTGLSLVHDVNINHTLTLSAFIAITFFFLYIGTFVYLIFLRDKYSRVISFFMLWFLIVLLPSTVILLNAVFQENRGYLAIVSFAVIAGLALTAIERRAGRNTMLIVLMVIVMVYSIAVIRRNNTWADAIILNTDAVKKAPNNAISYVGLAQVYMRKGDSFLALETAKKGAIADPGNYAIRVFLGTGYQYINRNDDAIEEYKKALNLNPERGDVWNELAVLYLEKDDIRHSEICIREGIKVWNNFPPLYYNLGKVFVRQGRLNDALDAFGKAISLKPSYLEVRSDLADVLNNLGRYREAELQYREIIRLSSSFSDAQSLTSKEDRIKIDAIVENARSKINKQFRIRD